MNKNNVIRKGLIIAIIVLFVGMCIPSSIIGVRETTSFSIEIDGILGDNGWYVSDVTITFTWDPGEIAAVYYRIDYGEWTLYTEPIVICEDGEHTIYWYYIDNEGNHSPVECIEIKIDQTPPTIELTVEKIGSNTWMLIACVYDGTSGVNRVEFYIDGEYLGTVTESPYEWEYSGTGQEAGAVVYDNAGNQNYDPPCYPVFNGTQYEGRWFITPVNVSFIFDSEIVAEIHYRVFPGEWTLYVEPFVIYEQGEIIFCWYWVDYNGNPSNPQGPLVLRIDYSPPELALITPEEGGVYLFGKLLFKKEIAMMPIILGKIAIDVATIDVISGIGNVTFFLVKNGEPPETHVSETPPYIWELTGRHIGEYTLTVTAYDHGGLSVNTTLDMIIIQFGILEIR